MDEKLKPCPFCGGKAYTDGERHWWSVVCDSCKCRLGDPNEEFETEAVAIETWNTRAKEQAITDENASLKETIQVIAYLLNGEKSENARLREALGEAENTNIAMQVALFGADALVNVIDEQIKANRIDARSAIGDARLDYGQPWKYEWGNRQLLAPKG